MNTRKNIKSDLAHRDFIAPYVSLALRTCGRAKESLGLPQVKSLILKAVHKYIRIYL